MSISDPVISIGGEGEASKKREKETETVAEREPPRGQSSDPHAEY